MNNYIEKGDKIQCSRCGAIIGTWKITPKRNTVTRFEDIDFEEGQLKNKYEEVACKKCGGHFRDGTIAITVFHIENKGWAGAR